MVSGQEGDGVRAYAYGLALILWLASVAAAYSHGVNTTSARWELDVAERDLRGGISFHDQRVQRADLVQQRRHGAEITG